MTPTLQDIINSAMATADSELKIASARDAVVAQDIDFLDSELKISSGDMIEAMEKKEEKEKEKKEEKEKTSSFDDADYALKLANALDLASTVVTKLAATDPQVMESGHINAVTQSPKPQARVTDRFSGGVKQPAGLPTNAEDFTARADDSGAPTNHPGKTAGWTRDKAASARVLRAKVAQAEALMKAGQIEAAQRMLNDVEAAKLAQDPSSPQPSMPAHGGGTALDTEPGPASHIPDNSGIIALTRAQAKDPTTREITQHFSEPPKKDNAVAAHFEHTDGQKLSADKNKDKGRLGQAVGGGVIGGGLGALLGHAAGRGRKGTAIGSTLGAAIGAAGGARSANRAEKSKEAQLRDFVSEAYAVYNDIHAPVEERQKAAGMLQTLRDRLQVDPASLLA